MSSRTGSLAEVRRFAERVSPRHARFEKTREREESALARLVRETAARKLSRTRRFQRGKGAASLAFLGAAARSTTRSEPARSCDVDFSKTKSLFFKTRKRAFGGDCLSFGTIFTLLKFKNRVFSFFLVKFPQEEKIKTRTPRTTSAVVVTMPRFRATLKSLREKNGGAASRGENVRTTR